MKVFVTGVGGQLGRDVMNELARRGYEGIGSDIQPVYMGVQDGAPVTRMPYISLDITNKEAVLAALRSIKPDVIVHCAAWTAVDLAEDDDKVEKVRAVNVGGTANMASAAKELGCKMVYLSTDYVFDGQGTTPWDPDFKGYKPLNVYGQTKLDGELAVSNTIDKYFIVRIAWVFGKNGKNYIKTMLNIGKTHDQLRIVCDQIGTPTYTFDLASLLVDMIETEKYGYYHATNSEIPSSEGGYYLDGTKVDAAAGKTFTAKDGSVHDGSEAVYTKEGTKTGYISWYDFSREIFRQAAALGHEEYDPQHLELIPVTTAEYGLSKAKRPFNSRLDKSKLTEAGFTLLPDWRDAVRRYLQELESIPES